MSCATAGAGGSPSATRSCWVIKLVLHDEAEIDAKGDVAARIVGDQHPSPITFDSHAAPELPAGIFIGWLGDMIEAVAESTETPREMAAMMALAVLGTSCQNKYSVRPERGYFEPINVWTVAAMDSGNRKSAVLMAMTAPLLDWEREAAQTAKAQIIEAEADKKTKESRIQHLRGKFAREKGVSLEQAKRELAALESDLPEIPPSPRLWADDVTPEKLGALMAEQGERLALLSDEGGLFEIMAGRYNGGVPNIDVFLKSHAGTPVRVDRGSRSPVYMNHPALTIGLSPQPDVLHSLGAKPGFRGRGLLARFLYMLPVSSLGYRTLEVNPIPQAVTVAYSQGVRDLLEISPRINNEGAEIPHVLSLSHGAWGQWKDFQRSVESDMREGQRFEHLKDWASKLPGAMARVAGLLHCAENAIPHMAEVDLDTMERTLMFGVILREHALAAFDAMSLDPDLMKARKIWRWVENNRHVRFSARDCFASLRGTFKKMDVIAPAFGILLERHYLFEHDDPNPGPGRRSRQFYVNPVFAEEWK